MLRGQVGDKTSLGHLHCQCTHLTSFAGGFLVMPNTLDLQKDIAMFLTFWENPVGMAAVIVILVGYGLLLVWARRKDKTDKLRVSAAHGS